MEGQGRGHPGGHRRGLPGPPQRGLRRGGKPDALHQGRPGGHHRKIKGGRPFGTSKIPYAYGIHHPVPAHHFGGPLYLAGPGRSLPVRERGPGGRDLPRRSPEPPGSRGRAEGRLCRVLRRGGRVRVHFDGGRLFRRGHENRGGGRRGGPDYPAPGGKGKMAHPHFDDRLRPGGHHLRHVGGDHGLLPPADSRLSGGGL